MPAKIAVITYTTWGHIDTLADAVVEGLESTGAHVTRFQFEETLPQEVLTKMYAAPKREYPVIKPDDLKAFDGILFGFGTRYGRAPAQVSAFFDATGGLWAAGALVGKFGGIFTGAGSQHGGHETTALTTIPFFAHHGICYVPIGFAEPAMTNEKEIIGGSAYGASYVAGGQGSLPVTESDKKTGLYQGKSFAGIVNAYVKGSQL